MPEIPFSTLCRISGIPLGSMHAEIPIHAVVLRSSEALPGTVFVAISGLITDGHAYIDDAVRHGVSALVVQTLPHPHPPVPTVQVSDTRNVFAKLNAALYGNPSHDLTVIGITGTDGKSTTTTMLWNCWMHSNIPAASVTTVEKRLQGTTIPNRGHTTTQEANLVQQDLAEFRDTGCTHVALESSSHALALDRIASVEFKGAIYTQVTHEHLELHKTRTSYLAAKARLLEYTASSGGFGILNRDDTFAYPKLQQIKGGSRITYSLGDYPDADVCASKIVSSPHELSWHVNSPWGAADIRSKYLRGSFNVAIALAALSGACLSGCSFDTLIPIFESMPALEGRMQFLPVPGDLFSVIIDFAHTPDSMEHVLLEFRAICKNRLWIVFGSAGERDTAKRSKMGAIAGTLADVVIITNEDPRHEDPEAIASAILNGVRTTAIRPNVHSEVILDRSMAISYAIDNAQPGDFIIFAGKGHESAITIGDTDLPWNEFENVSQALKHRFQ